MSRLKLPRDCTKLELAKTIANKALVIARRSGEPVTRILVEEISSELMLAPRYCDVPWPALRTVLAEVRRQAAPSGHPVALGVDRNLGR